MKFFKRLVMTHINTIIPETLDPLRLAYRPNSSTDDTISLHSTLPFPTWTKGMIFIDYSSAFNTIVPFKLITKLRTLNTSLCNWILDFLMGHPQVLRVGNNTSATLTLNTGPLKGACLVYSCTPCSPTTEAEMYPVVSGCL